MTLRVFSPQVGDYRYPDLYAIDFRLQKTLQIGPVTVIPALEPLQRD